MKDYIGAWVSVPIFLAIGALVEKYNKSAMATGVFIIISLLIAIYCELYVGNVRRNRESKKPR